MSARVALVTGGGRRIGRSVCEALADVGADIAVHYRTHREDAEALVEQIQASGGRAVALAADLADESQLGPLLEAAAEALGPVTCLVNNASVFERDEIDTVSRESWDAHLSVNLRAPFVLTQMFARNLPADMAGNVINILDQRVWNLTPHFMSYTVSKAALWTLTQTMALALAPRIRVNAIGPGPTLPSPRQSQDQFDRQAGSTPLGRAVTPRDIGAAVNFILDASAMTGQMIALDSGQHLCWSPTPRNRDIEE